MKTLFVMRHAKSSWENSDLADFERPLNKRGLRVAPLVGETIRKNRFQIDLIVSSPAERAKQTAILVKKAAQTQVEIKFDERIYEANTQTLLEVINGLNEKTKSAMLVGHNPGFENLVKALTGEIEPMPTAALAVIDLKTDKWSDVEAGCGNLRVLIRPKEINL